MPIVSRPKAGQALATPALRTSYSASPTGANRGQFSVSEADLPANLRLMVSYGRSVSQICRKTGINRAQFNRYLSGQTMPSLRSLRRICDYFGVDEHEALLPHSAFRELIRLRPPVVEASGDQVNEMLRRIYATGRGFSVPEGYYYSYLQPDPDRPEYQVGILRLHKTDTGFVIKYIELYPPTMPGLPRKLVYEGCGFVQGGKLFCLMQETRVRRSTWFSAMLLGDFDSSTILSGMATGSEPESGNAVHSLKVIWQYIGTAPALRQALKQIGMFRAESGRVPSEIMAGLAS